MSSDQDENHDTSPTVDTSVAKVSGEEGLSLDRLSEAFAEMLQTGDDPYKPVATDDIASADAPDRADDAVEEDGTSISPKTILESLLFVGNSDNQPISGSTIASMMRGVRTVEIDQMVHELNQQYSYDGVPYEIVSEGAGYRMVLRNEFAAVRDRFYGQPREATLSQPAIEILSLVAYQQPVTAEELNQLRGTSNSSILSQLVRRQLLRFECGEDQPRLKHYYTTQRFLQLFGLSSIEDLPKSQDLDSESA